MTATINLQGDFPRAVDGVSLPWLNAVLPGTDPVSAFTIAPLAQQGVTSQVYILELELAPGGSGIPSRLLLKLATDNLVARETLRGGQAYRREVDFYRELGGDVGMSVPRCYALGYDDAEHTFLLLMEYLGDASVRDILEGSVGEVEVAVDALAGFHGYWWHRVGELGFVERETSATLLALRVERYAEALANIRQRYQDRIGPAIVELLELYIAHAPQLAHEAGTGPLTLCHGDYHRKQLLFPDNARGRFAVIDWQTVSIDRGATDLARIVVTGLRNEDRQCHETALVERYHALLVASGVTDYPLDTLWEHYSLGVAKLLVTHALVFAGFDVAPLIQEWREKGMDWFEVFFRWPCAAADDHDVVNVIRQRVERLANSGSDTVGSDTVGSAR